MMKITTYLQQKSDAELLALGALVGRRFWTLDWSGAISQSIRHEIRRRWRAGSQSALLRRLAVSHAIEDGLLRPRRRIR